MGKTNAAISTRGGLVLSFVFCGKTWGWISHVDRKVRKVFTQLGVRYIYTYSPLVQKLLYRFGDAYVEISWGDIIAYKVVPNEQ